ncbi:MAG: hypothetical protein GY898_06345 [Proteobacteria bacterium]|nr:hypothetical protein [Pseudomonadota bacterium]
MGTAFLVHSLATSPFFAARAFLATFLVALTCRFAPELAPYIDTDTMKLLMAAPWWLTHDVTIGVLALLSALEFAATKDPDARALMAEVDPLLKGGFSYATTAGLIDANDAALLSPSLAGFDPLFIWALVPATITILMARTRGQILTSLADMDGDDDLGVQKLGVWLEDFFVVGGVLIAALLPLLALLLFIASLGLLVVTRFTVKWLDDRKREPCLTCGQAVHPTAPSCGSCKTTMDSPVRVGVFGQAKSSTAKDLDAHRRELVLRGRCGVCAERLGKRTTDQSCELCGAPAFADPAVFDAWLSQLDRKLPMTMGVVAVFSLIPLVGIVPGIIYLRLNLIAPMRRYTPRTVGCATRWVTRLVNILLILLQPVPGLGAITLPLIAFTNYRMYRAALTGSTELDEAAPATA